MYLWIRILQICQIIACINTIQGHVLISAHIDEFKTIAKKILPPELAEKLNEMLLVNRQKLPELLKNININSRRGKVNSDTILQNIDIDALVGKVKERLRMEKYSVGKPDQKTLRLKNKHVTAREYDEPDKPKRIQKKLKIITIETLKENEETDYDKLEITTERSKRKVTKESDEKEENFNKEKGIYTTRKYRDEDNVKVYKSKHKQNEDNKVFERISLTQKKHDSYEDYILKLKEENNKEARINPQINPKRQKINGGLQYIKGLTTERYKKNNNDNDDEITKKTTYDYDYTESPTIRPDEIRAQTQSLGDDSEEPLKRKITIRPTREKFTMSSPNYYYNKLPRIAQTYNFNEPLPQRDRKREDLRLIGNPPARVNGRVNLHK